MNSYGKFAILENRELLVTDNCKMVNAISRVTLVFKD